MANPFEVHFLAPGSVSLVHGDGGVLQGVIDGDDVPELILFRAFPLSNPYQYISIRRPSGDEIGIVADIEELNPESKAAVLKELRLRYLVPRVTRINRIRQEPGLWIWDLETDRGADRMAMRNLHEHVIPASGGRWLITDMDGKRCEIPPVSELDRHSVQQLSKVI